MRRIILSIAFLGLAGAASAQAPAGPGWSAFSGCWTPVGSDGSRNVAANTPRVCVVPNGNEAELLTTVNDSVADRTVVDASGQRHDVSKQGCSGWEKSEFSSDGRRLYLSGEQTCAGGLKRITSGIFAIASNGDWINAVDVSADSVSSVRVIRYAPVSILPTMAEKIRNLQSREVSDRTARISAQRDASVNAVIEANHFLSPAVMEAWIAELDQNFSLDDKTLVRLANEKVPPSVIDVMVAVSNPDVFSVRGTGSIERNPETEADRERRQHQPCFAPVVDPWAWYAYDPCDPYLRFSYYRPYYSRYGYPYYYGSRYGYGSSYYPYYDSRPVIIVPVASRPHGRMTKDGYKSGESSSGSSGSSGASTSRGSDTKSSGGSSSGSGGRTATKKPPANNYDQRSRPTATRSTSSESWAPPRESSSSSSTTSSSSGSSSSSSERVATRKPPAA